MATTTTKQNSSLIIGLGVAAAALYSFMKSGTNTTTPGTLNNPKTGTTGANTTANDVKNGLGIAEELWNQIKQYIPGVQAPPKNNNAPNTGQIPKSGGAPTGSAGGGASGGGSSSGGPKSPTGGTANNTTSGNKPTGTSPTTGNGQTLMELMLANGYHYDAQGNLLDPDDKPALINGHYDQATGNFNFNDGSVLTPDGTIFSVDGTSITANGDIYDDHGKYYGHDDGHGSVDTTGSQSEYITNAEHAYEQSSEDHIPDFVDAYYVKNDDGTYTDTLTGDTFDAEGNYLGGDTSTPAGQAIYDDHGQFYGYQLADGSIDISESESEYVLNAEHAYEDGTYVENNGVYYAPGEDIYDDYGNYYGTVTADGSIDTSQSESEYITNAENAYNYTAGDAIYDDQGNFYGTQNADGSIDINNSESEYITVGECAYGACDRKIGVMRCGNQIKGVDIRMHPQYFSRKMSA